MVFKMHFLLEIKLAKTITIVNCFVTLFKQWKLSGNYIMYDMVSSTQYNHSENLWALFSFQHNTDYFLSLAHLNITAGFKNGLIKYLNNILTFLLNIIYYKVKQTVTNCFHIRISVVPVWVEIAILSSMGF